MNVIYAVLTCIVIARAPSEVLRDDCRNDTRETYSTPADCRAALRLIGPLDNDQESGGTILSEHRRCYSLTAPVWQPTGQ